MSPRFFRYGELHLVLLALLRGRPMHGYEVMSQLTQLFGPRYRPSAGSVYPAFEGLEDEGLVGARQIAGRRVYELTAAGEEALNRRLESLAALEARTGVRLADRRDAEASLARFVARIGALAGRVDLTALDSVLDETAAAVERLAHGPSSQNRSKRKEKP